MCGICGCSDPEGNGVRVGHTHTHDHSHDHSHDHAHDHQHQRTTLETDLLQKNDLLAERNRGWLAGRGLTAINLVSAPGSGKTTLLEVTLRSLMADQPCCVIEGDQESEQDARRIAATGCPAVQINTGAGCHLEADMVARGLAQLDPDSGTLVFIENVGNLVCPALFDLGEQARVVLISVTEGEDKPLKYPHMIRTADLLILTKTDLLPHLDFDIERCEAWARQVRPDLPILRVSARNGEGMEAWMAWLKAHRVANLSSQAVQQEAVASRAADN